MLDAVLSLGLSGLFIGVLLAVAAAKFKVDVDPKIPEIQSVLPGANCGACGFPGCGGLAEAIVSGSAATNACKVGGKVTAEKIAGIMGVGASDVDKQVAVVYCQGDCEKTEAKARYVGVDECQAANVLGGTKACSYSCLGLGSCARACPFDALHMNDKGIPVVDREKCTGCGICVRTCPRMIIELVNEDREVHILCRSYDKGPVVRKNCKIGCIACQACVRACPEQCISMDKGTLAKIDYSRCTNCRTCVSKCPVKTIVSYEDAVKEENVAS